jgi:small subunit ribosomal protein S6
VRDYEVVFIVKPLEEEQTEAAIAKFENLITTNGGTVNKIDRWGKRRLAYEIKDLWEGFYCLILFSGEAALVAELDRVLKITDDILRHMIIRVDA